MIRAAPRYGLRAYVLGTLLILGYYFLHSRQDDEPSVYFTSNNALLSDSQSCIASQLGERVVVSVKTGASEAAAKIPALMSSSLRCAENVFLFSDLEQDIEEYHLYDALDTVPASMISNNPDFEFYAKQRELWQSGKDITALKDAKSPRDPDKLAAWSLDKYKFIHVLEKTWKMKPDMDWYILIDADTYLVWQNLLIWLDTLGPSKKSYFGSEVSIAGTRFAHGGSGIVLSNAIMRELVANRAAERWDDKTQDNCCGDLVLSLALEENGTTLQDAWPLMSGERPSTVPFGPATPEYWCRPALSFHHLTPADMTDFANFEMNRLSKPEPWTHAELFQDWVLNSLHAERENWDNLASDPGEFGKTGGVTSEAESFQDCAKACEADEKCFQYSHHNHTCYIGMSVRLGYEKNADQEGIWRSGWNKTRLADWASKQPQCDQIAFPTQVS